MCINKELEQLLIIYWTINWIIDWKAILWLDVASFPDISWQIKKLTGLELIPTIEFALVAVRGNSHNVVQRDVNTSEVEHN